MAISDEPGQVWRAGLRTPDNLVDGSALLTDSGRVTADTIVEAAGRRRGLRRGGLVRPLRRSSTELPDLLADEGFEVAPRPSPSPTTTPRLYLQGRLATPVGIEA